MIKLPTSPTSLAYRSLASASSRQRRSNSRSLAALSTFSGRQAVVLFPGFARRALRYLQLTEQRLFFLMQSTVGFPQTGEFFPDRVLFLPHPAAGLFTGPQAGEFLFHSRACGRFLLKGFELGRLFLGFQAQAGVFLFECTFHLAQTAALSSARFSAWETRSSASARRCCSSSSSAFCFC